MSFVSRSRWSDVFLATGCRAVSTCGDFLAATALVLALQERGAGGGAVAAVLIAAGLPPVLLARWTGRLADRVDSRPLLVATGLAQGLVCLALAYVPGVAAIVALVAVLGCGLAVTQPVLSALVPAMVRPADLARASAFGQTATSIGLLVAPALAGILVGEFGLRVPLLLDAASYLAIAAAGLLIRTRRGRAARTGPAVAASFRVRSDPLLWTMIVLVGVVVAAVSAVSVGEVFLIRGELHGSATVYGLLSATWTGALLIGAWLLARHDPADGRLAVLLLAMFLVDSAVILSAALVPALGWLVPLFVLGGLCNGGQNVAAGLLIARRVPAESHGRAYALYGAVAGGANVTGYLLGGVALAVLPVRAAIGGAGGLGLLAVLALALPMLRAVAGDGSADHEPDERRATQATA